jgi:hypothetical protein
MHAIADEDRRTLSESYSIAVAAGRTNADVMLAAGYVAAHNANGVLALTIWRMRTTKTRDGFEDVARRAAGWLQGHGRRHKLPALRREEAMEVARIALAWWLDDTCPDCHGRRHPTVKGTRELNYAHDCPTCHGTGKLPVERIIATDRRAHARYLDNEFSAMAGGVFKAMADRLGPKLEL